MTVSLKVLPLIDMGVGSMRVKKILVEISYELEEELHDNFFIENTKEKRENLINDFVVNNQEQRESFINKKRNTLEFYEIKDWGGMYQETRIGHIRLISKEKKREELINNLIHDIEELERLYNEE